MIILFIICLIITLVYNSFILIKYKKIPQSLSETSYLLGGNKRYLFTIYCFIISFCLLPILLEITLSLQFIPVIFCAGLLFSGCSPLFKEGLDRIVHYSSSYIAFGAYVIYMIFCMNWWWLLGYVVILGILCLWKYKCYVYFAEMLALIEIMIFITTVI